MTRTTNNNKAIKLITYLGLTLAINANIPVVFSSSYLNTSYNNPLVSKKEAILNNNFAKTNSERTQVISVMLAPTGSNVVLGGTVVPLREVTLSAQTAGRVNYLVGVEGQLFRAGEIVVAIDDDDLLAKREQAIANINAQSQALQNSQVQFSKEFWSPRSSDVSRIPGMGMPAMFDMFVTRPMASGLGYGNSILDRQANLYAQGTQIGQARSQHVRAVSQLQQVDAQLRDSRSVVPFDSIIVKKMVEVGQTVQPGQALLKLADSQSLQLKVEVPVRLVAGLRQDMIVPVVLDIANEPIQSKVAQIYPMADNNRHTVTVKFDLPQGIPGGPGMYAEVMIPDPSIPIQNLPAIPTSAVVWRGSLPAAFILNHKNEKELRLLRLGESIDKWTVTVLSGLQAGERVYANPPPGMSVGWVK